jgi:hypothetical protein
MLRSAVAHDFDEALAGSERHHGARAPEPRAVLSLMPSFIFAAAVPERAGTLLLWRPRRPVLGCKDHVGALAQYFGLTESGQTLRPDVPADDLP